jgi:hypothetical protein
MYRMFLASCCWLILHVGAQAQTSWLSAISGDFDTPSNWTNGVPNAITPGLIDAVGTAYTVSVGGNPNNWSSLQVNSANAMVLMPGGTLTIPGGLAVNAGTLQYRTVGAINTQGPLSVGSGGRVTWIGSNGQFSSISTMDGQLSIGPWVGPFSGVDISIIINGSFTNRGTISTGQYNPGAVPFSVSGSLINGSTGVISVGSNIGAEILNFGLVEAGGRLGTPGANHINRGVWILGSTFIGNSFINEPAGWVRLTGANFIFLTSGTLVNQGYLDIPLSPPASTANVLSPVVSPSKARALSLWISEVPMSQGLQAATSTNAIVSMETHSSPDGWNLPCKTISFQHRPMSSLSCRLPTVTRLLVPSATSLVTKSTSAPTMSFALISPLPTTAWC